MKIYVFIVFLIFSNIYAFAQEDTSYARVANLRAKSIVYNLHINDSLLSHKLIYIISEHYIHVNEIQQQMNIFHKLYSKHLSSTSQFQLDSILYFNKLQIKLYEYHRTFLSCLYALLSPDQVVKIKDLMTYNILPFTYHAYLSLFPELNDEQKQNILRLLIEAREYAMDAGSSEEKHNIFNKYKGKINNYLSKEGYNLNSSVKKIKTKNNDK